MKYHFNDIELDIDQREVRSAEARLQIEPKAFDVLHHLLLNRDRVVSKDELVNVVWNGRFISDSAVSTAIKSVRQVVGDNGRAQKVVRTVHGHGFRFVAEVKEAELTTPEPPTLSNAATAPNNLRKRRRSLIGREAEQARVADALRDAEIVSIVGTGGAGKSALAQAVAQGVLGDYPGGVWFCEFAPITEEQVVSTVLGAIDSSAGAGPVNAAMIVERFENAEALLILDNCEHVIGAAADLAQELIDLAPNLTVLTTSREALELPTETVIRLGGLDYGESDGFAVALFVNCARQSSELPQSAETTETIRQITERLEGLPLAIELAAPRLASSTPAELLDALDDQLAVLSNRRARDGDRHSRMDDTIAWSFNLLSEEEQHILTSLSVFSGAFVAQAAEAICETSNARDVLHSLIGQSMVSFVRGTPVSRFRLLEPIRQFCARQLDADRQARLHARHAEWFAARVIDLARDMRGVNEVAACEALTAEWADFGRALAWGRDQARADLAVDPLLALHIHLLWQLRIEGFGWLEAGVQACTLPKHKQAETDLVRSMGAWSAGALDRSEELMARSIGITGDTVASSYFQFYQGFAREDFDKVFQCGLRAWELANEKEDLAWQIQTTGFLACGYAMHAGDAPEIPGLFDNLERMLADYDWPSGHCCHLIGRTVAAFGRSDPVDVERYQAALGIAANRCYAPWFKVTAAGIEASRSRPPDAAQAQLTMYTKNLKSALNTGDMIQLPTILRAIAICLVDMGHDEVALRLSGFIPSVRGLGEKGSLAPGYEDAIERASTKVTAAVRAQLVSSGEAWTLSDIVETLERVE
ncbi:MAG: winged helix-turn-helix domain-containing protein [Pseudomonadota bacterium]